MCTDTSTNGSGHQTLTPTRTPLPMLKLMVIGVVFLNRTSSTFMIFGFLPFMVQYLLPQLTLEQLGFYAGILGSSFHVGAMFGGMMWGVLSDKYGRKSCLLLGLCGSTFSALMFGLSPNFTVAVIARFCWGLLNGNKAISKTIVAEITDNSNQSKAMTVFGIVGGIGRTVGPLIGGFLAQPCDKYAAFKHLRLFEMNPFLLPCLVIVGLCIIAFVLACFTISETLPSKQAFFEPRAYTKARYVRVETEESKASDDTYSRDCEASNLATPTNNIEEEEPAKPAQSQDKTMCALVRRSEVFYTLCPLTFVSFSMVIVKELFPLWACLPPPPAGQGLGFDSSDIGTVMALTGPIQILGYIFLYPVLVSWMRELRTCKLLSMLYILGVCLVPAASVVLRLQLSPILTRLVFVVCLILVNTSTSWSGTAMSTLINNSCLKTERGKVNGLSSTTSAAASIFAPITGGSVFAWSVTNGLPWPLDYHMAFYCSALVGLVTLMMLMRLPATIIYRREEPDRDTKHDGNAGTVELTPLKPSEEDQPSHA